MGFQTLYPAGQQQAGKTGGQGERRRDPALFAPQAWPESSFGGEFAAPEIQGGRTLLLQGRERTGQRRVKVRSQGPACFL